MNYLNITFEQMLRDFKSRLLADARFKNISSASIYGMFMEMLAATVDMTNFYMQRTAEEAFIDTARLDSSIIKHGKNLGYNPKKPIPAQCEIKIRIKGPLPSDLVAGTELIFNQQLVDLSYGGNKFMLDGSYSYVLTQEDIVNGASVDWYKDLYFSIPKESATYIPLAGISYYNINNTNPIKCFQGELKTVVFNGSSNLNKLGETSQYFDIDDLEFSNWYGNRDPFGFVNNHFYPKLSWCKVGIGPDQDTAFNDSNIYAIETQSIYLNENVVNLSSEIPETPFKICLIDTNSDKSTRITFSSERNICDIGLKTIKDNLYVQYIATKGKSVNATGVKASKLTVNNKFLANVKGHIVDYTNNIQFIINSDIIGGEDFESKSSIKINAPAYFSSRNKLITKEDFVSYFKGLSAPMLVQNAQVFGQQEIENITNTYMNLLQNNILYCLMGHMYIKYNGDYTIRNVLTDSDKNNLNSFSLYGIDYINHLADYIKLLYSYKSFYYTQYDDDVEDQYLKNIKLIRDNCKHNIEINSILLSLPPYVQYFDMVGTVYVKPLTDINSYTTEMNNKIYEYLDNRLATERTIYKSDIIKLYNENDNTESVNIDFKVSNIVKSDSMEFYYTANNQEFEIMQDTDLASYTQEEEFYKSEHENSTEYDFKQYLLQRFGGGWWNKIKIPLLDNNTNIVKANLFNEKRTIIELKFININYSNKKFVNEETKTYMLKCECISDDEYLYLIPTTIQPQGSSTVYRDISELQSTQYSNNTGVETITLKSPSVNDFYSMSNFSIYNYSLYGFTTLNATRAIESDLNEWLNNLITINSANRTIPLPYRVYSNSTLTREETIMRKGNLINTPQFTLSEFSFWTYFIPSIIKKYYNNPSYVTKKLTPDSDINSEEWQQATNLILDLYMLVKPGICDSILDDNNNITNFSTDMEVPVLNNIVSIQYNYK